jgi:hypothetical protein
LTVYDFLGNIVTEQTNTFEQGETLINLELNTNTSVKTYILEIKDSYGKKTFAKLLHIKE